MSTLNVFLLVYFIQRDVLRRPVPLFWKLIPPDFISVLGGAIMRVLGSKSTKAKPGDLVYTFSGWTEISIVPEAGVDVIQLPHVIRVTGAAVTVAAQFATVGRPEKKGRLFGILEGHVFDSSTMTFEPGNVVTLVCRMQH